MASDKGLNSADDLIGGDLRLGSKAHALVKPVLVAVLQALRSEGLEIQLLNRRQLELAISCIRLLPLLRLGGGLESKLGDGLALQNVPDDKRDAVPAALGTDLHRGYGVAAHA